MNLYAAAAVSSARGEMELLPAVHQDSGLFTFFQRKRMLEHEDISATLTRTCKHTLLKCLGNRFMLRFWVQDALGFPGTFGFCLKCKQKASSKVSAIKIVPISTEMLWTEKLQREIVMLKRVHEDHKASFGCPHAHFVHLEACYFNQDATAICMQMPYVEDGVDFFEVLNSEELDENAFNSVVSQVIEALLWLQSRSPAIIHRDLKPENILYIKATGKIKLIDFGTVRSLEDYAIAVDSSNAPHGQVGQGQGKRRRLSKECGSYGYMAPEIKFRTAVAEEADRAKVDNFALGKMTMLYFFMAEEVLSDGVSRVEDLGFQPVVPLSKNARDFINALCKEDPRDRLSMENAARHPWILGKVSDLHLRCPARPSTARSTNAPIRGVSLGAVQEFLRMKDDTQISSFEEEIFGVDFRADEFSMGNEAYKTHRKIREVAYLLYMHNLHVPARHKLQEAIAWCEGNGEPRDFLVDQLYTQCLSQMVANYAKENAAENVGKLHELLDKLVALREGAPKNVVHVETEIQITRFKIIECGLSKEPSPEEAADAKLKLNKIRVWFGLHARKALVWPNSVGKDTQLNAWVELSALLVDTRYLDLELMFVQDASECENICDQFVDIYNTRMKLLGDHDGVRVLIQSAKNCGKSYMRLFELMKEAEGGLHPREAYVEAKRLAVYYLKKACEGQLSYMGRDGYYGKIARKLEAANGLNLPAMR